MSATACLGGEEPVTMLPSTVDCAGANATALLDGEEISAAWVPDHSLQRASLFVGSSDVTATWELLRPLPKQRRDDADRDQSWLAAVVLETKDGMLILQAHHIGDEWFVDVFDVKAARSRRVDTAPTVRGSTLRAVFPRSSVPGLPTGWKALVEGDGPIAEGFEDLGIYSTIQSDCPGGEGIADGLTPLEPA